MNETSPAPSTMPRLDDVLHKLEALPLTTILVVGGGGLLAVGLLGVLLSDAPPPPQLTQ